MTYINPRRGIAITAAAVLCALGSLVAQSALADEHDRDSRDRGRHQDNRRDVHRDRGYQRGRDYGYDQRYYYDRRYNDGGYAPPIVYAPPRPEPGVRVVIPLHFR
jgi:Ni/Co efflux regulator RcnB